MHCVEEIEGDATHNDEDSVFRVARTSCKSCRLAEFALLAAELRPFLTSSLAAAQASLAVSPFTTALFANHACLTMLARRLATARPLPQTFHATTSFGSPLSPRIAVRYLSQADVVDPNMVRQIFSA